MRVVVPARSCEHRECVEAMCDAEAELRAMVCDGARRSVLGGLPAVLRVGTESEVSKWRQLRTEACDAMASCQSAVDR